MPSRIVKRDGVMTESFKTSKLAAAISKAAVAAGTTIPVKDLCELVDRVTTALPEIASVEAVQDAVEKALMDGHFFDVAKAYILYRNQRAETRASRAQKTPDPLAISDYIHASKYARYRPELGRREVFAETVARVEQMHLGRFPHMEEEIRWAFDLVRAKRVLPSMRSMQFAGDAILKNNNRIYNCCASPVDRLDVFGEALFLLLCGCGVGYSVQRRHVEKLPVLSVVDERAVKHHVIEDSIEGWADALKELVRSFVDGTNIEFAYHKIRPAGSPLKMSGGRAPGHLRLKEALERIRGVLKGAQGRKLRPIECHRIMCHAADAVLSGGIRRSAMICLFSLDDEEMLEAKTGNWWETDPWFANANNSVVLKRDEVEAQEFKSVFHRTKQWGEPGFHFVNDWNHLTNPCSEVALYPFLAGKSGWAFCVGGDTKLLTRTGREDIRSAVGREVEIWNGTQWCKVRPFKTGANRKLYRVTLNDGSYLDCTENHKWLVKDRFMKDFVEVETKDLMSASKYAIHTPRVNVTDCGGAPEARAYEYGFFLGDGNLGVATPYAGGKKYFYPLATLYGTKCTLPLEGHREPLGKNENGVLRQRVRLRLDVTLCRSLKDADAIPAEVFAWDKASILAFIGGWADADGTQAGSGIRVYGTEYRMRDLQQLLTKAGINSSVCSMSSAGEETNLGVRKAGMWYVQIPNPDGIRAHRLDVRSGKEPPCKGKFQVIKSVEELPGLHDTFCLEEPETHLCLFNNVLTRQCNLTEINAAKLTCLYDFEQAARAATLIGTLQASYTDMPYLGETSEEIAKRDALLGIGMTGMFDAPDIACNPEYQREIAELVKKWNADFASRIGINPAARTTLIKPSGTTSLELGCVASGHHPHHARRYIRRVTADELEHVFQAFKAVNPHMCVRKPDGKYVIEFPVEAPPGAIVKADLGAIQFLEMVKSTQQNWVIPGSRTLDMVHNVSNTVTVKPDEWEAVADYLWQNRDYFTGVSLLSSSGDKDYAFAPMEEVKTTADELRWNAILEHYKPVDYTSIVEDEDATNLSGEAACAGGICEVT